MSRVRFAELCDHCGKRSEEYTAWNICRGCLLDTCDDCDIETSRDDDEGMQTLCKTCAKDVQ